MIATLILAGTLAQGGNALQSQFDLSSLQAPSIHIEKHKASKRYLIDMPDWDDGSDDDGVQVKVRWRKVRLRVPL